MKNKVIAGVVVGGLGVAAVGVALGAGLARQGGAQQPGGLQAGWAQYACLTLSEVRDIAPEGNGRWEFQDPSGRYDAIGMAKTFGVRANETNRALVVTAVAAKGWELVSHTDATGFRQPHSSDGTSGEGAIRRAEQWWFRKR